MKQYHNLMRKVLYSGTRRPSRTGIDTYSTFGEKMSFYIFDSFPLVTTKKIHLDSVIHELLWFIKGSTDTKYLVENGVRIWNEWADEDGYLGPIYGHQWRSWGGKFDQISDVIESIKSDPHSRRHIVSAWNVGDLDRMALPPCHVMFQFFVEDGFLDCQLYQRSADIFLGVPFNIASYSLLTMMIAQVCGLKARWLHHVIGDAHIYDNHIEQCIKQLERKPKKRPIMTLDPGVKHIDDFVFSSFALEGYDPHPHIAGKVAV